MQNLTLYGSPMDWKSNSTPVGPWNDFFCHDGGLVFCGGALLVGGGVSKQLFFRMSSLTLALHCCHCTDTALLSLLSPLSLLTFYCPWHWLYCCHWHWHFTAIIKTVIVVLSLTLQWHSTAVTDSGILLSSLKLALYCHHWHYHCTAVNSLMSLTNKFGKIY